MTFMRQKVTFIMSVSCALAGLWVSMALVKAQTASSEWSEPVNLSRSGATVDPFMVLAPDGDFHVIWQDAFADTYMYSHGQNDSWSSPINVTLPFTAVTPHLLADDSGRVHAFWLDPEDSLLLYSAAPITGLATLANWLPPLTLADVAVDMDAVVDKRGALHLLYLWPEDTNEQPAGIYYQRTTDDGQTWLPAKALYHSPYFRGLAREDTNVELTTTNSNGRDWLFAAWDNRPRKRVFLARSGDGGVNWNPPTEVAGPESGSISILPFNIKVGAKGDNVVLVWSSGHPDSSCRQYAQSSNDLGETWAERQLMPELLPGLATCIRDNHFEVGSEYVYLLSTVEGQVYLWAWDGSRWSQPQLQAPLTSFDNQETLNAVVFRCRQSAMAPDDRLVFVGCEEVAGGFDDGDIWLLTRSLGLAAEWFPPPAAWSPVTPISSGPERYYAQTLVADSASNVLAFWALAGEGGGSARKIYVARLAEGRWSLPEEVLKLPEALVGPLTAVVSPAGQVYLSWGDALGQLYLARNTAAEAHIASTWTDPTAVPGITGVASNPVLAAGENDILYLAYAVAVNEGRGVYLRQSTDGGRTWDEPVMVFDGAAAGWEVVGPARLTVTDDGLIHLLLEQQSLLSGDGSQTHTLYYTHSEDGGQTFTPASLMAEGIFSWSALAAASPEMIHQLWQAWDGSAASLQHAYSMDGGQTWSRPFVIDAISGPVTLAEGEGGRLFLLNLNNTAVAEWYWTGEGWVPQDDLNLSKVAPLTGSGQRIAAALAPNGLLTTLFAARNIDTEPNEILFSLQAANRTVAETAGELPAPTPGVVVTGTPSPAVSPPPPTQSEEPPVTSSPTPEATAVPAASVFSNTPDVRPRNAVQNLLWGVIPGFLLIVLIFGGGLYMVRLRRR